MKKTLLKSLALAAVGSLCVAGSALALPLGNGAGVLVNPGTTLPQHSLQTIADNVFGVDAINVANNTTNVNNGSGVGAWTDSEGETSAFTVTYMLGVPGSSYYLPGKLGIYDFADSTKTAELFDMADDPNNDYDPVFSNTFGITDGNLKIGGILVDSGWSGAFGFYYKINGSTLYTEDDLNDDDVTHALSYLLHSGMAYNTTCYMGANGDHGTFSANNDWLLAFDWNNSSQDLNSAQDFNDGVFLVEDMAAVPEPATMLLFGTGLVGLAGVARRRKMTK